jgi:hypothetical protein
VGWRQGVVFTRNEFTIDTLRMRIYAPMGISSLKHD